MRTAFASLFCALLLSACAGRGTAPVTQAQARPCDANWNLERAQPLDLSSTLPVQQSFNDDSACVYSAQGAQPRYALFRLPRFREDWLLSVRSRVEGQSLFAPELILLDGQGQETRRIGFERFGMRGDALQAHLFFSTQNAEERYLVVQSALEAVGRTQKRVVSGSFFLPVLTGLLPLVYMQGTEEETQVTFALNGIVELRAEGAPAARRDLPEQRRLREELGGRR